MQKTRNFDLNRYLLKGGKMGKVFNMEDRYRTCCNCWHIRAGTVALGLIEMVAVSIILSTIIRQLRWKSVEQALCSQKRWRDCLTFRNFNLTMTGDYIIAIVLFSIIFCIILLFYGILTCRPRFLLPHLIVQAIGLILSFGYFILYAWTYFYADIYVEKKEFMAEQCIERMWLSAIILVFAIFQCYLFVTVVKCSLYLNQLKMEQLRRFMQFEEVSNRVKSAKENGLWRSTSWGGGFQQYRGQYEKKPKKTEDKKNLNNRVQWNLEKNLEKSISCGVDSSSFSTLVVNENEILEHQDVEFRQSNASDAISKSKKPSASKSNVAVVLSPSETSNNSYVTRSSVKKTSRTKRSRESDSSNNSSFHAQSSGDSRRQNTCNGSPPRDGCPTVSAVIYTKVSPQSQKPLPQAVVKLQATTKFPTFDNVTDANGGDKNGGPVAGRHRHSSHGSMREGRRERGHRHHHSFGVDYNQSATERHGSVNSSHNPTAVLRVKIDSKALTSSMDYCK